MFFNSDATVLAAYAQSSGPAGQALGCVDFQFENVGLNTAYIKLAQFDDTTSPSGYKNVGAAFTLVPGGTYTASYVFVNKRIGFFGSGTTSTGAIGATKVNITPVLRNKGDLRGAQIDIVVTGRRSWGYDKAFDKPTLTKKWSSVTGASTSGNIDAGTGAIGTDQGV